MQTKEKERARGAYKWLKMSPLLTGMTYFFVYSMGFSGSVCGYTCSDETTIFINAIFGIFGSALWHLILLQYVNNTKSEFIKWHGRQALLIAGGRTLLPLLFVFTGWIFGSVGTGITLAFFALIIAWVNTDVWGKKQVERGECALAAYMRITFNFQEEASKIQSTDLSASFKEILKALLSDDDVTRISALMKLETANYINDDIRRELQAMAADDNNADIRKDAGLLLAKFTGGEPKKPSERIISTEVRMTENQSQLPVEILKEILNALQSDDVEIRLGGIARLHAVNYSSEAIRGELEKLALRDPNEDVRKEALNALDLATQRNVRSHSNKMDIGSRRLLLQELTDWERFGLVEKENADVIRRRYDFDITAARAPIVKVQAAPPAMQTLPAATEMPARQENPQPEKISAPESQPTLTETLLSETSIKIALYLGAFFVIASAAILAALSPELRLPILFLATIAFGGLSVAIRKRLPQPSFAIFIVFSFLLPITANVLEETLGLSLPFNAAYWVFVSAFMALIWAGGTWLYDSRLFSITAFASLIISFYRIGDIFDASAEFYPLMMGLAALAGLAGVWALTQWKDKTFAMPLFIAAQALQFAVIAASVSLFFAQFITTDHSAPMWNLASIFTFGFAFVFYVFSDFLIPFILFSWLASATLFTIPWLLSAAFELKPLSEMILFFVWGLALSASSEVANKFERVQKYNLPILLVSIGIMAAAVIYGFVDKIATGFVAALLIGIVYTVLHIIRPRGWLWTVALFSFTLAYFTFFNLPFMKNVTIFFGYILLGISLLFLLPDLFLKNDLEENWAWRLPLRIYGALFTTGSFLIYSILNEEPLINTAVMFAVYAIFFTIYALRYNTASVAYLSTAAFAISTIYFLNHFEWDYVLEALSILSAVYFFGGFALKNSEARSAWRTMLESSGLILGGIISLVALFMPKDHIGWFIIIVGAMFIVEMYSRKQNLFEVDAQIILNIACYLVLKDLGITETSYLLLAISLVILSLDMLFTLTFKEPRPLELPVKIFGGFFMLASTIAFLSQGNNLRTAIGFGIYTIFFLIYTTAQRKALYGYIPAAYLPLFIFYTLEYFKLDMWLPALTGLAVLYFIIGALVRKHEDWSHMFRYSALALGTIISLDALFTLKETGGWYVLVVGLLFAAEMYLSRSGFFEIGVPIMFNIGAFIILHDFKVDELAYQLLTYSLVWLVGDLAAHLTFTNPRPLKWIVRGIGASLTIINYGILFLNTDSSIAAIGFGVYALLFLTASLIYQQPNLFYAFTLTLPLFATFLFRAFDLNKWIHPVIAIAVMYYALGYALRAMKRANGWDTTLLFSGLGIGIITSIAAPILGGIDAAIPVALAGTLWAAEAFWYKNAWLALPANGLYLLAYFVILVELNVDQPQFFSMGAALLGMIQHYLLTRAGSKTGAFIMGMVSQLILLGTTYIQMANTEQLGYFFVLFFQSLTVIFYGIVIRSRSLTFTPIGIVVLSLFTVLYSALKGLGAVVLVGCSGVILLMLGIIAVLMRERITKIGERMSDWKA